MFPGMIAPCIIELRWSVFSTINNEANILKTSVSFNYDSMCSNGTYYEFISSNLGYIKRKYDSDLQSYLQIKTSRFYINCVMFSIYFCGIP